MVVFAVGRLNARLPNQIHPDVNPKSNAAPKGKDLFLVRILVHCEFWTPVGEVIRVISDLDLHKLRWVEGRVGLEARSEGG
jgi:hypothetical protein